MSLEPFVMQSTGPSLSPGPQAMNLATGSVPFANLPLGRIRRSDIEQWVKAMVVARCFGPPSVTG